MIQTGGHFNPRKITKIKKRGGGGGLGVAPPMMVAEVMIRIGVQLNLCKQSEELIIQLGVQLNLCRKSKT